VSVLVTALSFESDFCERVRLSALLYVAQNCENTRVKPSLLSQNSVVEHSRTAEIKCPVLNEFHGNLWFNGFYLSQGSHDDDD